MKIGGGRWPPYCACHTTSASRQGRMQATTTVISCVPTGTSVQTKRSGTGATGPRLLPRSPPGSKATRVHNVMRTRVPRISHRYGTQLSVPNADLFDGLAEHLWWRSAASYMRLNEAYLRRIEGEHFANMTHADTLIVQ